MVCIHCIEFHCKLATAVSSELCFILYVYFEIVHNKIKRCKNKKR